MESTLIQCYTLVIDKLRPSRRRHDFYVDYYALRYFTISVRRHPLFYVMSSVGLGSFGILICIIHASVRRSLGSTLQAQTNR